MKTERLGAFGSQDVQRERKGRSSLQVAVRRHHVALWVLHTSKTDVFLHAEYHSARTDLTDSI